VDANGGIHSSVVHQLFSLDGTSIFVALDELGNAMPTHFMLALNVECAVLFDSKSYF
jgi:hypothetical protein